MEVLITGASGFLGTHLVEHLTAQGHSVHALMRPTSVAKWSKSVSVKTFIFESNTEELKNYLQDNAIQTIIHTASCFKFTAHPSEINGLIQSNIQFGTHLLEATKGTQVEWFVNTGSSWQNDSVNLYSATKEAFEAILKFYTESTSLKSVTLKLFDTYGPKDQRGKIISVLKEQLGQSEPLAMSSGQQLLDLCHIQDIARAYANVLKLISQKQTSAIEGKCFGLSSGEHVSLKELAQMMEHITQKKLLINWGARPLREREVMTPWKSFNPLPDWSPLMGLRERLQEFLLASGPDASFKQE